MLRLFTCADTMLNPMTYCEKLTSIIRMENPPEKSPYILNNHNGELVNKAQINLLDAEIFPVSFIHETNEKLLGIHHSIKSYDFMILDRHVFIWRLQVLSRYYMKSVRVSDAMLVKRLSEKISEIEADQVTITEDPNIHILDKQLHPDLVSNLIIRRVLHGFLKFRKFRTEDVLHCLEQAANSI